MDDDRILSPAGRAFDTAGGGVTHIAEVDPGAPDLTLPAVLPGPGRARAPRTMTGCRPLGCTRMTAPTTASS
ncbi:MAG: hypothetical protein AAF192_17015 [Pseudomonadota bacterium]